MFSFDESTEISARFHRKVLRKDFFTKITFRKSVHADFYGYLDVNFVVSVFDPNNQSELIYYLPVSGGWIESKDHSIPK